MAFKNSITTATMIAALSLAARTEAATNLLRNSSFEDVAPGGNTTEALYWKMGKPDSHGDVWGSASRENWRAVDGEHIATIRGLWADCGTYGGWWQELEAAPGSTYRFSGWFYSDPEWVAGVQEVKIEFWDKDYKSVIHARIKPIEGCDMDWAGISLEATAPADAAWVRVVVNVVNTGASGALQMDSLELTRTDHAPEN